jgi:Xaa-Pro dipeptidase
VQELVSNRIVSLFMPHGLGHFVGLTVHDTTIYPQTVLEVNMVLTIEPGIYFNKGLLEPAFTNARQSPFLIQSEINKFLLPPIGIRSTCSLLLCLSLPLSLWLSLVSGLSVLG